MKKIFFLIIVVHSLSACSYIPIATEYDTTINFKHYSSQELVESAWDALRHGHYEGVQIYADKCIELYTPTEDLMQQSLTGFPGKDLFYYWALNDVGMAYFVKAEAFREQGMTEAAIQNYQIIIDKYFYSQSQECWFWQIAETAAEMIAELQTVPQPNSTGTPNESQK